MHHSPFPFNDPEKERQQREMLAKLASQFEEKLGATGNFPQGKLTPTDEGEIKLAVGIKDKKVILDFGTSVTWIGFSAEQALDLANSLIERAASIRN